jgi:hypothetical protein
MPRFAVLIHDSPRGLHCDFFLEQGDSLKTWALPRIPEQGLEIIGDALDDHRLLYLDYEGTISGGRGTVTRWDQGTFFVRRWTGDEISVEVDGSRIAGRVELRRQTSSPQKWLFRWLRESPAIDE